MDNRGLSDVLNEVRRLRTCLPSDIGEFRLRLDEVVEQRGWPQDAACSRAEFLTGESFFLSTELDLLLETYSGPIGSANPRVALMFMRQVEQRLHLLILTLSL